MDDDQPESGQRWPTRRRLLVALGTLGAATAAAALGGVLGLPPRPERHLSPSPRTSPVRISLPALDGTDVDASAALSALLATSGERVAIRGNYVLDNEIVVPANVRQLELTPGTTLRIRGDHPGLSRLGDVTFREVTGFDMPTGTTTIAVGSARDYTAGEWLLLSGADVVSDSPDRYGYLRQVVSVAESSIVIDRPLPRAIVKAARTSLVELAPSLWITGTGTITSTDPAMMFSPLLRFIAVESPRVTGVSVTHSGGTGISVSHCEGGEILCSISDLLDDGEKHFGYGVSVSGASRGVRVGGDISRVRHAVTTNPGPLIDGVGQAGEPEDCVFAPLATDCSNKSVDTHRLGWGTIILPNVVRGNGGVQVRADNTIIRGGTITDCSGPGITVGSRVAVSATIRDVSISDLSVGQTGILCSGPADIVDPTIVLTSGTGISLRNDSSVRGGSITGTLRQGVVLIGSNNIVSGVSVSDDVAHKLVEGPVASSNKVDTAIQ